MKTGVATPSFRTFVSYSRDMKFWTNGCKKHLCASVGCCPHYQIVYAHDRIFSVSIGAIQRQRIAFLILLYVFGHKYRFSRFAVFQEKVRLPIRNKFSGVKFRSTRSQTPLESAKAIGFPFCLLNLSP